MNIEEIMKVLDSKMVPLFLRWLDEKKYEPFEDYESFMKNMVNENYDGITFIKGSKDPFGFFFKMNDTDYIYKVFEVDEVYVATQAYEVEHVEVEEI